MTYKIDTSYFLAWLSALIGSNQYWLARCQDNITEWDIMSWFWWPGLPVAQHYIVLSHYGCALSQVSAHPDMTVDVAKLQNRKPSNSTCVHFH